MRCQTLTACFLIGQGIEAAVMIATLLRLHIELVSQSR
jgi:hypothetical protein